MQGEASLRTMDDSNRDNTDLASSQPYPASSPLSSVRNVDLSDCEDFEEKYLTTSPIGAGTRPVPVTADGADPDSTTHFKQSDVQRLTQHGTLDEDEDELIGDSIQDSSPRAHDVHDGNGKDSFSGKDQPDHETPVRRMPRRQKKVIWKQPPKKAVRKSAWTAERLLTDTKSPLAKADIRACALSPEFLGLVLTVCQSIVTNPMAWDILDADSKAEILALFPHKNMILEAGTANARPNIAAMMNDDTLRGDCAEYASNIANGFHDHDWLVSAYNAHEKRSAGEFDDYLVQKVYDDWGTELPEDFKPRRESRRGQNPGQKDSKDDSSAGEAAGNGLCNVKSALQDSYGSQDGGCKPGVN